MKELAGQVAVVTGAGRGIGRSIAAAFAAAGADLVLVARTDSQLREVERTIAGQSRRVLRLPMDISEPAEVAPAAEKILREFGRIDILVNNAGLQGPIGSAAEVPIEEWIRTIQVNLVGTFLMCRSVIPSMIAQKKGKIINFSGGGATRPRPYFSAYGSSKAAVIRFTETLAEELKPFHIQVNAIAPGAVYTDMTEEVIAAPRQAGERALDEARQVKLQQKTPQRAAALAVFLASSASDGLTGRLISAVHDDWENVAGRLPELMKSDLWTLRRVDETLSKR